MNLIIALILIDAFNLSMWWALTSIVVWFIGLLCD